MDVRRLFGDREVLDVGCGLGLTLAHLGGRGVGVDHNEHSVRWCRHQGLTTLSSAEFANSELARPRRFGALLAAHLIEHMRRAAGGESWPLLADIAGQLGPTVERRRSFPLSRAAGRLFAYNEFVLVATKAP